MSGGPLSGIVRHQLFQPSETFITTQAYAMRTYRPLFVGRDRPATVPSGAEVVSIDSFGGAATASYLLTRRSDKLVKALAERGVSILHAHFGVEGVHIAPTAKALRVPLVTTLHGFDVTVTKSQLLASRKPSWINYVTWRGSLFDTCARFICVSEHVQRKAVEWGYPADRTTVLPIGVDTDRIKPTPPEQAPRIFHAARLVTKKGTADLLNAFATVVRAVPRAELTIVGDGPLRESLTDLARRLGIAGQVRFLGARRHDEVLAELSRSSLLCVPSVTAPNGDMEGLPTVVLEAFAAGRPVVATEHGGIPEAVTDGRDGFLVAEHDVATLAERLIALLRDPDLAARLGAAARATAESRFDLRAQTGRLEDLYGALS